MEAAPAQLDPARVAYLTDVEGMWSRVESFARDNPLVVLDAKDQLHVKDGAVFVFGGDAIDRGPWGRRVVRALLDVKKRQPDRVVLLAGNRDLNKLRLRRELQGHPPERAPDDVKAGPASGLLRWIFENTMGAREAFEHRRTELAAEGRPSDDDAIARSYIEDTSPDGDLAAYLMRAQLTCRVGCTLFAHGGVTDESLRFVPDAPKAKDVDAWVRELNAWYHRQMDHFAEGRLDADGKPLWSPLLAYQAPVPGMSVNQASVVYGRTADALNNPELPARAVIDELEAAGVRRLVVGHTPNGDVPSILREGSFELIVADTSRGRVDVAAKLALDDEHIRVDGLTILDDGEEARVAFDLALDDTTSPIGQRVRSTGRLVKGRTPTGDCMLFRYLDGFRAEQTKAAAARLRGVTLEPPRAREG
jgi:hypothetical protein